MKTVCAASVLFGREAFATLGDVAMLPDGAITRDTLRDADALIIRSKTAVTAELLAGTPVAFVGTATAGYDHLDLAGLGRAGVAWSAAPGCNANSVAEYIVAALLTLSARRGRPLKDRTLAVVGVGQVGRRVAQKAEALGLRVLLNDPPRARAEGDPSFQPVEEILPQADWITLHVPLTADGPCPTRGMVDCRWLARARSGAFFLNAARGEVVDESVLRLALDCGALTDAALDVWAGEPAIDPDLLARAALATPHIAGYSYDGKLDGTRQVYAAACRFFEREATWDPAPLLPAPARARIELDARGRGTEDALRDLVRRVYDIEADDRALRQPPETDSTRLARRFETLRREYPIRREFPLTDVAATGGSDDLRAAIAGLGFRLA